MYKIKQAFETMDKKKPHLLLLILFISYGSVGAQFFTSALPAIDRAFSVSGQATSWVITIYLIGFTVGQLFYSSLANHYGRLSALKVGIGLSFLGALICIIASNLPNFSLLLLGRLVGAIGGASPLIVTNIMIREAFPPKEARKVFAFITSSFAILPGLTVTLSGFLTEYLGWESCAYGAAIYALFAFVMVYLTPETMTDQTKKMLEGTKGLKVLLHNFLNKRVLFYSCLVGLSTSIVYIFSTLAPLIGIDLMGLSPSVYGTLALTPFIGQFFSCIISARLVHHLRARQVMIIGILLSAFSILLMIFFFTFRLVTPYHFFGPLFLLFLSMPLVYTNAVSLTVEVTENAAATSSVMSFMNVGIAFLGSFISGFVHSNLVFFTPILFLGVVILQSLFFVLTKPFSTKL